MKETGVVYDWSKHEGIDKPVRSPATPVEIDDETFRDGLQGVQLELHPSLEDKKIYLQWVSKFVEHADIGFPSNNPVHQREIEELIRFKLTKGLEISLSCAARAAVKKDITPMIDISAALNGFPLEADIFLDVSQYRATIEGWKRDDKFRQTVENIKLLKQNGLPIMFVAERATSTPPDELLEICKIAAELGVDRICIADTQGKATHNAVRNIFRWSFEEIRNQRKFRDIKFDAHFHNDRGLSITNCLVAAEEGVDRIHATSFCIGERAGNVDLATLLLNLNLEGYRKEDLSQLKEFSEKASRLLKFIIPPNAPVIGKGSHSTASGVHAAAFSKEAAQNGHPVGVYFAYNPRDVGAEPGVEIGRFSGSSNVKIVLAKLGIEPSDNVVRAILEEAERSRGLMSDEKVLAIVNEFINGNGNSH